MTNPDDILAYLRSLALRAVRGGETVDRKKVIDEVLRLTQPREGELPQIHPDAGEGADWIKHARGDT